MRSWVFAYGSNMDLGDLRRWFGASRVDGPAIFFAVAARLHGHRRCWDYYSEGRACGAANINRAVGSEVFGAALLVDQDTLHGLDRKEGSPAVYERRVHWVELMSGGFVHAWVYSVTAEHRRASFVAPSREYRGLVSAGARAFSLPRGYTHALDQITTSD